MSCDFPTILRIRKLDLIPEKSTPWLLQCVTRDRISINLEIVAEADAIVQV